MIKQANKIVIRLVFAALVLVSLQGCLGTALVVGGVAVGASVAHERRSAGTVMDDEAIEFKVSSALSEVPETSGDDAHINVISYNYQVLLTGEVPNKTSKNVASRQAMSVEKVKKVANELAIAEKSSLGARTTDVWITTKVKANLFSVDIDGFDPTRVKVATERRIVYLMGLVTREEADAAVEVARNIEGVEKVVKIFEYVVKD
ncbi:MAG: BON domain-containing protein [Gammaproteobacteria bacterium]|nr:MAG: BON domain-containing protein [Gammaproteobacteria bacterium]